MTISKGGQCYIDEKQKQTVYSVCQDVFLSRRIWTNNVYLILVLRKIYFLFLCFTYCVLFLKQPGQAQVFLNITQNLNEFFIYIFLNNPFHISLLVKRDYEMGAMKNLNFSSKERNIKHAFFGKTHTKDIFFYVFLSVHFSLLRIFLSFLVVLTPQ